MKRQPVLSISGVAKHYRSGDMVVRALDGVSLDIMPGEVVGVLGPSGSGKSTMLLIAGLLEAPTLGQVAISGEPVSAPNADLEHLRDFRRRKIGFVFQKANLLPFLTAAENVAIALEIDDVSAKAAHAYAIELLKDVDLDHRRDNLPARLSGGEQQRVAVARALANNPTLLLADEPTAALDAVRGRQVIEQFRDIARTRDAAVVVVTHDQRALEMFDRVVTLVDGKLVQNEAA
jgi:putative ABC transport system ATP-binding protein